MARLISCLLFVGLAGCAHGTWVPPANLPQAQAQKDDDECKQYAYGGNSGYSSSGYNYNTMITVNQRLYNDCMAAHGWTYSTAGSSAPLVSTSSPRAAQTATPPTPAARATTEDAKVTAPGDEREVKAKIKQHCIKQWPDDYVKQAACVKEQWDAYRTMQE